MFLAGMKMHEKFDPSDVRFSSEGINQMVFFWTPAVFYAWVARPLMTYEPSSTSLLRKHGAVPRKRHFQTGHIRTRSLRRPQLEGDNWGVTNKIPHWGPRVMTLEKPRYVRAVEAVTGCKVVDSEYDGYLDHLHARVDCTK